MIKEKAVKKTIKRHGLSILFVHWTVAISTFILIFSGFGQMPLYKRYMLDRLPGLSWVTNFSVTLSIHYWAAAVLILVHYLSHVFYGIRRDFDMLPRKGDMKQSAQIIMAVSVLGKEPENR